MANQLISGAYGCELVIQPGQKTIYFPDISVLRGKVIKHIDVCDDMTLSRNSLAIANVSGATITLRTASSQINIIENLNISELSNSIRLGNRMAFNHKFDLAKSFITLATNDLVEAKAIMFIFWYDEPGIRKAISTSKTEISSFEVTLRQSRTMFTDEKKLKSRRFRNLLLGFPALTPNNATGISSDTAKKAYITLQRGNLQFIQNVPLYSFYQAALYEPILLENIIFDFTNSFIDVASPGGDDLKTVFFNAILEA